MPTVFLLYRYNLITEKPDMVPIPFSTVELAMGRAEQEIKESGGLLSPAWERIQNIGATSGWHREEVLHLFSQTFHFGWRILEMEVDGWAVKPQEAQ